MDKDIGLSVQHIPGVTNTTADICRISNSPRTLGLDASSFHLPDHEGSLWAAGHGPVCIQTDSPATLLLQLETGSSGGGSGCFPAGLETTEGVCQPTLMSDQQSPEPGTATTGPAGTGSTSMERSDLASNNPGGDFPQLITPAPDLIQRPTGHLMEIVPQLAVWPVSGKDMPASSSLSEEASKPLLQSWRLKLIVMCNIYHVL